MEENITLKAALKEKPTKDNPKINTRKEGVNGRKRERNQSRRSDENNEGK